MCLGICSPQRIHPLLILLDGCTGGKLPQHFFKTFPDESLLEVVVYVLNTKPMLALRKFLLNGFCEPLT